MASHRQTLAQQLAEFDEPAPKDVDPEDERPAAEGEPLLEDHAREHYLDVGPSALRKLADGISDSKYEGQRTSRAQLAMESDEESGLEEDEDEDEEMGIPARDLSDDEQDDDEEEESEEEEVNEPPKRNAPPKRKQTEEDAQADDLSTALRQKRDEDRSKGKAVSRQLTLWDSLLDARIRLQKSVQAANRLPPTQEMSTFLSDPACLAAQHAALDAALALSDEAETLRAALMAREGVTASTRPRAAKRRRLDIEDDADAAESEVEYATEVEASTKYAAELEHAYHPYLAHTLQKWSAKVAAVAPSALGFNKSKNAALQTVPVQVSDALRSEGARFVGRTRTVRGVRRRVRLADGDAEEEKDADEGDVEVFDDTDFYQQLLRDVVDSGAGDRVQADWIAAQKARKARKQVDTRASKGRKLRYDVHEKLQDFMVPVPLAQGGGWPEQQIDELFASLLGRGFEHAVQPDEEEKASGMDAEVIGGEMLKGLRVFG
ncbi:TRAUB-domain-containing protein [Peniophora sp. CONT]|nr:TRAUB-domain-containing protein [Peniophora sp. CONT]